MIDVDVSKSPKRWIGGFYGLQASLHKRDRSQLTFANALGGAD
ncbi:hypothetical protein [Pseudomonas aeruginosa]|nr:hypothetical protein [Pseudomonas aeruginosa]MDE9778325.1 hypothetical protein [Pseudomonas aeruginosa]